MMRRTSRNGWSDRPTSPLILSKTDPEGTASPAFYLTAKGSKQPIARAGLPSMNTFSGTSLRTTLPAPMLALSPIRFLPEALNARRQMTH